MVFLAARNLRPAVRLACDDLETGEQLEILGYVLLAEAEFTRQIADRVRLPVPEVVDDRAVSVIELLCEVLASDDREVAVAGVSQRAIEADSSFSRLSVPDERC